MYKKLNKETNGEYTVQRMVCKEGGVRDQVRGAVMTLETCLGIQLWPKGDPDEDGEEMEEVQYEGGMVERRSQWSDGKIDEHGERSDVEECGDTKGDGDDTSDNNSSLEGSEIGKRARLTDQEEAKGETEGIRGEKEVKLGDEEGKGGASGGAGLLINLNQFSGSAIWSEEESKASDVTAL